MFIDEAKIRVHGGHGGNGIISFNSTRHNPKGGPSGGSGGEGGSVILQASESISTLNRFSNETDFRAKAGEDGGRNNRRGARGEDRTVLVPVGTLVYSYPDGELLADLSSPGDEVVVASGGEGGRGNNSFTTAVRQAPRLCERGLPGDKRILRLELKLVADVGIIGYPNVGKSSLLTRISGKRAKVADYPFTTLVPNLGVVDVDGIHQFVCLDIPGLIEGAHTGKGLGDRFLRHVERTRVLIHLLDLASVEGRDPLDDFNRTNEELEQFDPRLSELRQIIAGNKIDLVSEETVQGIEKRFHAEKIELLPISVATGNGIRGLVMRVYRFLQSAETDKKRTGSTRRIYRYRGEEGFVVDHEGEVFTVRGAAVERLVKKLVLNSRDAQEYLEDRLKKMGVLRELGRQGCSFGDTVRIGDVELEFTE